VHPAVPAACRDQIVAYPVEQPTDAHLLHALTLMRDKTGLPSPRGIRPATQLRPPKRCQRPTRVNERQECSITHPIGGMTVHRMWPC
jgi:hypothetical protein